MTDTLEDAIEYVEKTIATELRLVLERAPTLWMATPGSDSDVVRQVLEGAAEGGVTGLFKGPWPYGPTYVIEEDGPRPRPRQRVRLLSARQSVARLQSTVFQP
ncbi:hypothetical protein BJF79_08675 [Actinomadura sp. CNU-125]|nr:hypothetical protein BJF79_08675 [Actinomadura sp. CNU-125]